MAEIDAAMRDMQEEKGELSRKVEAAKVFMSEIPGSFENMKPKVKPKAPDKVGTQDAAEIVLAAIAAIGGAPTPLMIRHHLLGGEPVDGQNSKLANSQYFYTVLMRLTQTGRLIKEGKGYRLPTSSAQAGTTAGDRGSDFNPLVTSGPLTTAPEVGGT